MVKGTMALIDTERAELLYGAMSPAVEISGGSAANTVAGLASLGSRAAFIGRVRDDQLGAVYRHDLRAAGVQFDTPPATEGMPTGRCLIVVTPDAERTLNTYLGASSELGEAEVDAELLASAAVTISRATSGTPRRTGGVPVAAGTPMRPGNVRSPPLRPVRGRTPPRDVPRAGRALGRHPLRQRSRDLRAVPGRRLRHRGWLK